MNNRTFLKYTNDPIYSPFRLLEYNRQHLWIIELDDIPAWLASSTERPKLNLGSTKKIKYFGHYDKIVDMNAEWMPLALELNDPIVPSSAKIIYDKCLTYWKNQEGFVGFKDDYVFDSFKLKLLDPHGSVSQTWILHKPFITGEVDFNGNPLSYSDTKLLKVKITLDYNFAELIHGTDESLVANFT